MPIIGTDMTPTLKTPVQQFYSGEGILITGGTGFLGKVLIEKLLRSCPNLSSIYLIVRTKKGQDAQQRLDAMLDEPLFDLVKKETPKFRHKITVVSGDCSLPGLGMSDADRQLIIRDVSIIFNVAATVRFDERLKQAVAINIQGPKEMLNLCRQLPNLKSVVHVSTAYSNCNRTDIDEKFYDPPMTGDNAIKLVQSLDENKLDSITQTLLGEFPNTYAFTKNIAEQVVLQYGRDLPIGIFRPAIVISSFREPLSGWIDNIFGPTGALVGGGAGLIRTLNVDRNCTAEMIPADLTINALITAAWDVANNKNVDAEPPIYNYHSSWTNNLTWGQYIELSFKHGKKMPSMRCVWCYSMTDTKNVYFYKFLTVLLHLIPAILIDAVLLVIGKEARLLKMYKKIHKYTSVTSYFSTKKWTFSNKNVLSLWEKLSPEDKEIFFFSMKDFDWDAYMQVCVSGIRRFIFKDTPDTIPKAKKRMSRLVLLHNVIKYVLLALLLWGFYSIFSYALSFGTESRYSVFSESIVDR